jgi:capsular exopolysaccharide synthesis family protein
MEDDSGINIREILFKYILRYWYLYVLGLVISLTMAKLYLRYTPKKYEVKTTILIKDDKNSGALTQENLLKDLGLDAGESNIENEIAILKSKSLMVEVVKRQNLNVSTKLIGRVSESDLYTGSPIKIEPLDSAGFVKPGILTINILDSQRFQLNQASGDPITYSFGLPVATSIGQVIITRKEGVEKPPLPLEINISGIYATASTLSGRVVVQRAIKMSDVLEILIKDEVAQRGADIINNLVEVYREAAIEDKNVVSKNTLRFIEERISLLTAELSGVEIDVEAFKRNNQIFLDNPDDPTILLENVGGTEKELNTEIVRLNITETIEDYLKKNLNQFELLPANLATENELQNQINIYNERVLYRERLLRSGKENNPVILQLNEELKSYQGNILLSIQEVKRKISTGIENIQVNLKKLQGRIGTLPRKQREFLEMARQQHIKENLYLYLLEKREETALSLAMTTSNSRLIDPAVANKAPVEPQSRMIWLMALSLGLVIPAGLVYLITALRNTIQSEADIKELTSIPIFGTIGFSKRKEPVVVKANSRSAIAEMFRMLRTNLQYARVGEASQTIVLTSHVSGEGKSFITLNLGISMALAGYKTVIIGLDLRKPKLSKYLDFDIDAKGISQYLVGAVTKEEIIHPVQIQEKLSFIPSGPIPPNPGELLQSEKLQQLLTELSKKFDYILIDSPPVGLVSDAMVLNQYASRTIFVVHYAVTRRDFLKTLEEEYQQGKLQRPAIVFNGVKASANYGYGNKYGYGYGYGYYEEDGKGAKNKKIKS